MERKYLAKYRSRSTDLKLDFYKGNGFIYLYVHDDRGYEGRHIVAYIPSKLKGFEEVALNG